MPILPGAEPSSIEAAAAALAAGQLVGLPTETVYGLAARADDDAAVARIFSAKGRPSDHPLIVHVHDMEAAAHFCDGLPPMARTLASHFWPGPVTLVVQRRPGVASAAAAGLPTVGLRCPDHPVASALLRALASRGIFGVAAPSANRFGRVSPTAASHVAAEFGPELIVLDGGACREGIESAIVDCTREVPYLLRPGTVNRDRLEAALGSPLFDPDRASPRVSGSLASHYAPSAAVELLPEEQLSSRLRERAAQGQPAPLGVYSRQPVTPQPNLVWCKMPDNPAWVAHELFAVLRHFDAQQVAAIWVEAPPRLPAWDGVRDRLERASVR